MLRREIIAVCFEIHTKHINTLGVKGLKIEHYVPSAGFDSHKAIQTHQHDSYNRLGCLAL